jgi:hypothetical protein
VPGERRHRIASLKGYGGTVPIEAIVFAAGPIVVRAQAEGRVLKNAIRCHQDWDPALLSSFSLRFLVIIVTRSVGALTLDCSIVIIAVTMTLL